MRKLKTAMFGTGFMGKVHTEAISAAGQRGGRGGRGVSQAAADKFAASLWIPRATADWKSLLADPEIDAVHVCTPNVLHHPMVKAALEAGKHVLCEKPLTMNSGEARELWRWRNRRSSRICTITTAVLSRGAACPEHGGAGELGDILIANGPIFRTGCYMHGLELARQCGLERSARAMAISGRIGWTWSSI